MNEYQPLDINRNPIGVLQPGKQYYIEGSGDSVELPEAGVYMLSVESGKVVQIDYPDGTDSRLVGYRNDYQFLFPCWNDY